MESGPLAFKRRANLVNAWDPDILLCQTRTRFLVHQLVDSCFEALELSKGSALKSFNDFTKQRDAMRNRNADFLLLNLINYLPVLMC